MTLQNIDEMGPKIEGWIRHLVTAKAKFHDQKMHQLADSGKLSDIYSYAMRIIDCSVAASDWDKTMAIIIIGAITDQSVVLASIDEDLRQARIENMRDEASYLGRNVLDTKTT